MNPIIFIFIVVLLIAAIPYPETCCKGAVEVQVGEPIEVQIDELRIIAEAADRNNCRGDDFTILLAIRRAENGGWGKEFGIRHRLCRAAIARQPQRSLDIQAGWAAATIVKNRRRWTRLRCASPRQAGDDSAFIDFLGDRYCPASADPHGNKNWKANVKYFYERFKAKTNE